MMYKLSPNTNFHFQLTEPLQEIKSPINIKIICSTTPISLGFTHTHTDTFTKLHLFVNRYYTCIYMIINIIIICIATNEK